MQLELNGGNRTGRFNSSKTHVEIAYIPVCVCACCCVCTSEYSCVFACLSFTREQVGQDAQIEVWSQQLA